MRTYLSFPDRNNFVPVALDAQGLRIWILTPAALPLADHLAWRLQLPSRVELAQEDRFYRILEQALALWEQEQEEDAQRDPQQADDEEENQELIGWSHEDAPIVRLVNKTLKQAISQGASDIHLQGGRGDFEVRFRLDGELRTVRRLAKALQPTVVARIKVMADLDVAETRAPQDGRIQVRLAKRDVDIRVSVIPTLNGEKAVLRILDRSKNILSLPELGFEGEDLDAFRRIIKAPYGILLVTGPTGSGKTTTLYAALTEIIDETKNILTVEDPVEYHLEGVNQVQVNRAAGVTFSTIIRSFLRQDPDIILVGEIRDEETASTAIQASLTGHLVLSTLHTNDAPTAVTRLLEMNVEPFLLASSMVLAMAQRLVRVLCPACRETVPLPQATQLLLPDVGARLLTQQHGRGCGQCYHTGFAGRRGIFELLPIDEAVRSLIIARASIDAFHQHRRDRGLRTMWEHGLTLVEQGITTVEEVLRVTRM
ncbi:type II secretion system protein E (plasmid) [Megalodesulfovibrio gigas DSM 1382 = ATCC 19364]|uniref:Type II secretion system protein E n=1 Tax=Megalodesulfovibrio gigas (strain ATCC 19364 / DSM 1382 / NCIMB 9332 / VKM B-1759) TaxID=1121448 RepID=T2GFX0_MEGG1|nr:type II secretion system protein E [Megalodesulfovibrio gigas DSM 1382 = ATCC 19364]